MNISQLIHIWSARLFKLYSITGIEITKVLLVVLFLCVIKLTRVTSKNCCLFGRCEVGGCSAHGFFRRQTGLKLKKLERIPKGSMKNQQLGNSNESCLSSCVSSKQRFQISLEFTVFIINIYIYIYIYIYIR